MKRDDLDNFKNYATLIGCTLVMIVLTALAGAWAVYLATRFIHGL